LNIKNRLRYAFTRKAAWIFVPLFIIAGVVPPTSVQAAYFPNSGFEDGTFTGWNRGSQTGTLGSTITGSGTGVTIFTGSRTFTHGSRGAVGSPSSPYYAPAVASGSWTFSPNNGTNAVLLQPKGEQNFDQAASALNLSVGSVTEIKNMLISQAQASGYGSGTPTDAAWITREVELEAGTTYTMAWNYVGTDYVPYNDGSITSLIPVTVSGTPVITVNNYVEQYALLGFTNPGTGDYSTNSFGSTGWQTSTYEVSISGTYKLGFAAFNLDDTGLPPALMVDSEIGSTERCISGTCTTFGGVEPNNETAPTAPPTTTAETTTTTSTTTTSTTTTTSPPAPTSLEVTSLDDTTSSGTLRWAITQANANSGGIYDSITFDVNGTITLTSALPQVTQNLTVTGNGRTQTIIDGNNLYRPFNVGSGKSLTISDMTLKQGQATNGGLIFNGSGTVVATNIRFTGMTGGSAVFNNNNGSTATYTNCTFDYLNIGIAGDYGSTPQLAAGVTTWANEADSVFTNKTYVVDSVFSNNTHGINNYRFTKVQNSQFTNNSYGANVTGLNRTQILDSTFTSNGIGVYHNSWIPTTFNMGTDNRLITGNTFTNNSISMYLDDGYNNGQKNQSWVTITGNSWDAKGVWVRYYQWNGTSNAEGTARPYTTGTVFAQSSNTFPDSAGDPTNLTVTQSGSNIVLDWDAPVVSGYPVERYAIFFTTGNLAGWGVATGNVGDANALNTEYTFAESYFDGFGVASGSTWKFRIRSDNDTYGKYSQYTSEASIVIGTPPSTTTTTTTTTTVPVDSGPVDTSPVYTEPVNTNPVYTEPINTEPVYTEPIDTNPVDTEPIDTEPVYTDPIDTEPVYTEPIDTDPVDTEPIDTEPVYIEPIDTDPVDTIDSTDEEIVNIIDTIDTTSSEEVATVLEDIFDSDISTDQLTKVLDAVFTADVEPEVLIAALDTVLSADISTEEFAAVLEAVFDEPLSDEQFTAVIDSIITEDITDEQFAEVLDVLESDTVSEEQVAEAVDSVLENGVTASQATDLASSSKVLESIDTTQAEAVFEAIPVGELTQAEEAALVAAVTDAPQEIKETFEETIDIYGEGLDDYVAVGSQVDVGSRRTLIAASTAVAAVAGAAATGGPSGGSTGGSGGSTGGSGGSNTEGRSRREEEGEEPAGEIAGPEDDDDGEYTRNSIFNYYLEEGIWKKKISWLGLIRKFVNETAALSFTLAGSVVVFITLSGDTRKTAMIATGVALAVHYIHVLLKNDES